MRRKIQILIGLCCLIAITDVWVGGQPKVSKDTSFNSISKTEVEIMLADVAKTNPKLLDRLAKDPEMKKLQIENLKQLLTFASQAQRDGLASEPTNRQELDSIRAEILALNYDREINKNKAPLPAFGFITEEQVAAYWREDGRPRKTVEKAGSASTAEQRTHEAEFHDFLNAKIEILKASGPEMKDSDISEEEETQARYIFAKIRIYKAKYERKAKAGELPKEFIRKTNLQVKLQQAQFLARLYSEKVAEKTKVTDEEVAKYIAEHPELNTTARKAKAEEILRRVQTGDDFAGLANEFSEDPGNIDSKGNAQGGIYKDVAKGKMVASFEQAALALEPGQVAPNVVETDFGYHIIKLEKKWNGKSPDGQPMLTYDVRHILIATTYKDPAAPGSPGKPVKDYVRDKLEAEREKHLLDKLVADNNIQVPLDFDLPKVIDGQAPTAVKKRPLRGKRPVKKHR